MTKKKQSNPKDSVWYSTPNSLRKRKGLEITLSDLARALLDELAEVRRVSRSLVIEELILAATGRKGKGEKQ